MHELRLVAVSEDGTYLVLASTGRGTRFMLPVDDRLRAAVRGQFSRLGQYEIEVENPLRPKEIQARIRSGETAEAISEISGIPIERVRWFEGPVLQEREYIAQQAQRAAVRIAGEAAPAGNLEELVTRRIGAHQLETGDAVWDSWKREDRTWQLKLVFLDGGQERVAHWLYEPRHNTVTPADEEAARFSSPDPAPSPTANVTPFAPRRAETEAPRPSTRPAPERVGGLRRADGPLDDPLRPSVPRGEEDGPAPRTGDRREEQAHRWAEEPRGYRGHDAPAARPQRPAHREAERFERAPERDERPAPQGAERSERSPEHDERPAVQEAERFERVPERDERPAHQEDHGETGRRDEHGERTPPRRGEAAEHDREEYVEPGRRDTGPARPAPPVFEEEAERYGGPAVEPVARPEPPRPEPRPAERPA
ncbi:septation protein SepH, partial [Nocardiopsis sp. CC223A]|uniref:septation protein SepH n=1 Tax=Nocardiopsis sp. CC223A TaxID=3044051 RepID=UPI00278C6323